MKQTEHQKIEYRQVCQAWLKIATNLRLFYLCSFSSENQNNSDSHLICPKPNCIPVQVAQTRRRRVSPSRCASGVCGRRSGSRPRPMAAPPCVGWWQREWCIRYTVTPCSARHASEMHTVIAFSTFRGGHPAAYSYFRTFHHLRNKCSTYSAIIPCPPLAPASGNCRSTFYPCGLACSGYFIEMESYDMWPVVSGFFHSACFQGSSMV